VDDLPPGLGRGYPTAMLLGESEPAGAPEVGEEAPGFALQLGDGRTLMSDYLKGRPVVINHWATWCPPCRVEMPELVKAAGERPEMVFIAVNNMEPRAKIEPFAAEYGLNFLVALDPDARLNDLYAVRALPTTFFIDREGTLAAVWEGVLDAQKLDELLALIE
jgi:peroxiredoxin